MSVGDKNTNILRHEFGRMCDPLNIGSHIKHTSAIDGLKQKASTRIPTGTANSVSTATFPITAAAAPLCGGIT